MQLHIAYKQFASEGNGQKVRSGGSVWEVGQIARFIEKLMNCQSLQQS
jgi:hypothetical protein